MRVRQVPMRFGCPPLRSNHQGFNFCFKARLVLETNREGTPGLRLVVQELPRCSSFWRCCLFITGRRLMVWPVLWVHGIAGSSPVAPTIAGLFVSLRRTCVRDHIGCTCNQACVSGTLRSPRWSYLHLTGVAALTLHVVGILKEIKYAPRF